MSDKLPPHSVEAEQAVLGCCLLAPQESIAVARENFKGRDQVFYDLRHQAIWQSIISLYHNGAEVDVITLQNELKKRNQLDRVGGYAALSELPDKVPSVLMIDHYLGIVWEKYLARQALRMSAETVQDIYETDGLNELDLARLERNFSEFKQLSQRRGITPQHVKTPLDFEEEFYQAFQGESSEEPGEPLINDFKFKIRMGETTLVSGDDGCGKSTVLSYWVMHLAQAGLKSMVASFEMPSSISLWIMGAQLMGKKRLPDSTFGKDKAIAALGWLEKNVVLYDYLGIGHWNEVLDAFRYATEHMGVKVIVLDSVMRIGIPDDDYAQQGLAAAAFAQFAKDQQCHLFYVIHENKGDSRGKSKIRGSKLWSANADNVVRIERNAKKWEDFQDIQRKISDEYAKAESKSESLIKKLKEDAAELKKEWDTRFVLQKQRYPGTQQNAGKFVQFDRETFQFYDRNHHSIDWLRTWAPTKREAEEE